MHRALFLRTLALSTRNVLANKKQTALTLMTVILGSLTISTVFTVNTNVDLYIEHLIGRAGGSNLFVSYTNDSLDFSDKQVEQLRQANSTTYVVFNSGAKMALQYQEQVLQSSAVSYGYDFALARPLTIETGTGLGQLELTAPSGNLLINEAVEKSLGLRDPIGKQIKVSFATNQKVMNIIGVAKAQYENDSRPRIWIPQPSFEYLVNSKRAQNIIIGARDGTDLYRFEEQVRQSLGSSASQVQIYNPQRYFEDLRSEYQTFIHAGLVIGLLALLGGTLGVLNLMLMSIRLRKREIGLYRALGFSTSVVLLIFVAESILTLNLGGFIGSALGCFSGLIISSQLVSTTPVLSGQAFFFGFVATFLIGILFSFLPARRAANLEAVEALK